MKSYTNGTARSLGSRVTPGQYRLSSRSLIRTLALCLVMVPASTGCQVLTYSSASGESFRRLSLGTFTSISSLEVESGSNGLKRVQLAGYRNDNTQALGIVTEAAVRAALHPEAPSVPNPTPVTPQP
jgi:hypothetical protein